MVAITAETSLIKRLWLWLSNHDGIYSHLKPSELKKTDYTRLGVFLIFHLGMLGVLYTGVSTTAVIFALSMYFLRMFFITGFYHRYFSHKSFRTSRAFQWLMA
ncbi:MAG: acyl-CoA desaturase, partial [Gammaproteobacteria bacterium]|nr:acyl-CoA desaturase [Gammaproteobacteria bacterium]